MNLIYVQTVDLLLEIDPSVFRTPRLAMKGGTALNLFVQELPRLSVDIDVVYCDHTTGREKAIAQISEELNRIQSDIQAMGLGTEIKKINTGDELKIWVSSDSAQVKVEINSVFRGTVLPVQVQSLTSKTQEFFSKNIQAPLLNVSELYGSKLVAAMDRQHPRDLFDVKKMFESHGLTAEILDCFVVYLAGHNRPVHEVLFSNPQPIEETFKNEFFGMTNEPVSVDELELTRSTLVRQLHAGLTDKQREFLLSLVQAKPDWSKMPYEHLKDLPALKWKIQNLLSLKSKNPDRFKLQHTELMRRFDRN
jgi:predicted nucleotidyltransferase component of viral defense system